MLPATKEEITKDATPAVLVTYRRAAKIGEDYTTIELGVVVPAEASDEVIAQAVSTGDRACIVLRDEVEAQITQVLARANAPTQEQWRKIEQLLKGLGVPPEESDEALALIGGRPATRRKAEDCVKRLMAIRRNGNGNGKSGNGVKPAGWRWPKEAAQQGEALQAATPQDGAQAATQPGDAAAAQASGAPSDTPPGQGAALEQQQAAQATTDPQAVAAAMAFTLPFGPQSHPDWKGKKLGDIAMLPEGPRFLEFLKDAFHPTTPEGEKLKAHAVTLLDAPWPVRQPAAACRVSGRRQGGQPVEAAL